jgi:hypothetical protein
MMLAPIAQTEFPDHSTSLAFHIPLHCYAIAALLFLPCNMFHISTPQSTVINALLMHYLPHYSTVV